MELQREYRIESFHQADLGCHGIPRLLKLLRGSHPERDKETLKRAIIYVPSLQSSSQLPVS